METETGRGRKHPKPAMSMLLFGGLTQRTGDRGKSSGDNRGQFTAKVLQLGGVGVNLSLDVADVI